LSGFKQSNKIQFGTDGWRAIIADAFTFENIRIVAQALSEFINSLENGNSGVAISFDTRFMSPQFARLIAEVVSSNNIPVFLSNNFTPTPVLSFAVKNQKLAGGIMVTASHNPYHYSGLKFKAHYGGPAMIGMTQDIERQLYKNKHRHEPQLVKKNIHEVDFSKEYVAHLRSFLKFDLINSWEAKIIYDPMHAAGSQIFQQLLSHSKSKLQTINKKADPLFGGNLPEPILGNLRKLQTTVIRSQADVGLATDGDADRFGVLDDHGEFVQLHDLMPLMFHYLLKTRGWSGDVIRTTSMANTIDKMAKENGRKVIEVPVGFKNVTEKMLEMDVLIGGEESGGFGYKNHIPERDGILSCLLLIEMLSAEQKSIRAMVAELREKYGPFSYDRIDHYFDHEILTRNLIALRKQPLEKIGEFPVASISLIDGIKFYFADSSWMLMRVSQTEPLGRIYVSSDSDNKVSQLLKEGVRLLTAIV
jgi:phosphomannomutase